jgi:hypothetical protein
MFVFSLSLADCQLTAVSQRVPEQRELRAKPQTLGGSFSRNSNKNTYLPTLLEL